MPLPWQPACCWRVRILYLQSVTGASVSKPNIDEFAVIFPYIYIFWRMSCRKSLLALILWVLASFINSKKPSKTVVMLNTLKTRTRSRLPPRRRQQGWRHTIHGPTYSMARVIGATLWQEGSICQCQSLVTWTDLSNGHSYSTCIACHKRQGECFICPCHFRARPAEYMVNVLGHSPCMTCLLNCFSIVYGTVPVLCICLYILSHILWPIRFLHSDDSHVHATTPFSACALAEARPTISCIHLVILISMASSVHLCTE